MTDIPKEVLEAAERWDKLEYEYRAARADCRLMASYIVAQQPDPRIAVIAKALGDCNVSVSRESTPEEDRKFCLRLASEITKRIDQMEKA